jgi:DNA invertase Pin-like site-specific DNA recombinase
MTMSTAAYLRVSTGQQSIDQQQDAIAAAGITPDRIFTDTASGRAGSDRPGWAECMGWIRQGDHLVVVAVDRLGRSVREVATALPPYANQPFATEWRRTGPPMRRR